MKRTLLSLVAIISLLVITETTMASHRYYGHSHRGGVSVSVGRYGGGGYYSSPYSSYYYSPYYGSSYSTYPYYSGGGYYYPGYYSSGYYYYPQYPAYYSRPGIQFRFGW